MDMAKNEVTIKGVVEPQAVCSRIMKKTKRMTQVLSPLPEAEGEPIPEIIASQVIINYTEFIQIFVQGRHCCLLIKITSCRSEV